MLLVPVVVFCDICRFCVEVRTCGAGLGCLVLRLDVSCANDEAFFGRDYEIDFLCESFFFSFPSARSTVAVSIHEPRAIFFSAPNGRGFMHGFSLYEFRCGLI